MRPAGLTVVYLCLPCSIKGGINLVSTKDTHQIDRETEEVIDPLMQFVYERYYAMN